MYEVPLATKIRARLSGTCTPVIAFDLTSGAETSFKWAQNCGGPTDFPFFTLEIIRNANFLPDSDREIDFRRARI